MTPTILVPESARKNPYFFRVVDFPQHDYPWGMSTYDPHAHHIYIDGSALKNPGGPGGLAGILEHPTDSDEENQKIFQEGYFATTNNRMELRAAIKALEYVRKNGRPLRATRFVIVTDSMYVWENHGRAHYWKENEWKGEADRPIENRDLWHAFLAAQSKTGIRTALTWHKGKKSEILKEIDKLAKEAAHRPAQTDIGFRPGKVGHSQVEKGGSSNLFHAVGQKEKIQIYRKSPVTNEEHKIFFSLYSESEKKLTEKCYAYTHPKIAVELHRGHRYEVVFNDNHKHPVIVKVVKEVRKISASPQERSRTVIFRIRK